MVFRLIGVVLVIISITVTFTFHFTEVDDRVAARSFSTIGMLMAVYIAIGAWRARDEK